MKTQGPLILPPGLRENEALLHFFWMDKQSNKYSYRLFDAFPRLAFRGVSEHLRDVWFNLLAGLWESGLHYCGSHIMEYVGYLRIELMDWKLERVSEDEHVKRYATHTLGIKILC